MGFDLLPVVVKVLLSRLFSWSVDQTAAYYTSACPVNQKYSLAVFASFVKTYVPKENADSPHYRTLLYP